MANIIKQSREFSNVEIYIMTIAQDVTSVKDLADGEKIVIDGYLLYEDVKKNTGEAIEILSIITDDKKVYACQSATFKQTIFDIFDIFPSGGFTVIKTSGKTKAGRDYINCKLDVTSVEI